MKALGLILASLVHNPILRALLISTHIVYFYMLVRLYDKLFG